MCNSRDKTTICRITNLRYTLICKFCKGRQIRMCYHGESCRNGYIQGREYGRQLEKRSENSVMYKHIKKEHADEEEEVEFEMKLTGRFKTPMTRIIDEAIRIQNQDPKTLLNSKSEYHGPAVKRKIIEGKTKSRRPGIS